MSAVSRSPALALLVCLLLTAGCGSPAPAPGTGSISVTSVPSVAEVYIDNEYRGTTPVTVSGVVPGSHALELRLDGYRTWSETVPVEAGSTVAVAAVLEVLPVTLPVTIVTTTPGPRPGTPQIHVDGYWTYPQGRTTSENPVPLIVHTEAFNVGSADAREVTVAVDFTYDGREVCWSTIYLGTLPAGGHVSRDSLVLCTLPSPYTDAGLDVRFSDLVVRT